MIGMHYDIKLPTDYDMGIIRDRVMNNGYKTDGIEDLLFKAYLISEVKNGELNNRYAPLYVWKDSKGMNTFIFEGSFDKILESFGWQKIQIGLTSQVTLNSDFSQSNYVTEDLTCISPRASVKHVKLLPTKEEGSLGVVTIYNPDKWKYATYNFFKNKPVHLNKPMFEILHLSLGN